MHPDALRPAIVASEVCVQQTVATDLYLEELYSSGRDIQPKDLVEVKISAHYGCVLPVVDSSGKIITYQETVEWVSMGVRQAERQSRVKYLLFEAGTTFVGLVVRSFRTSRSPSTYFGLDTENQLQTKPGNLYTVFDLLTENGVVRIDIFGSDTFSSGTHLLSIRKLEEEAT